MTKTSDQTNHVSKPPNDKRHIGNKFSTYKNDH